MRDLAYWLVRYPLWLYLFVFCVDYDAGVLGIYEVLLVRYSFLFVSKEAVVHAGHFSVDEPHVFLTFGAHVVHDFPWL